MLFCCFELISIEILRSLNFNSKNQISFIFLNSIAHYQHGYWNSSNASKLIDTFLEIILKKLNFWEMYNNKKGHIVTGLSQKPSDTHYEYNFQTLKIL